MYVIFRSFEATFRNIFHYNAYWLEYPDVMLLKNSVWKCLFKNNGISFLMLLVFYGSSNAQIKVDSLEHILWNTATIDTNRVLVHEKLAYHYRFITPDTAYAHAIKAYNLSEKLNYRYGLVYSLNHLGVYYQQRGQFNQAMSCYLKALNNRVDNRSSRITKALSLSINNIGLICFDKEDYEHADFYFRCALKIDSLLNNSKGVARELGNLGKLYMVLGKSDSALIYLNQSLELEKGLGHTIGMLETMVDIGQVYFKKGDLSVAKQMLNEVASLNKGCYVSAKVWMDELLGQIYLKEGDFRTALDYELSAMECARVLGDKNLCISISGHLAEIYKRTGNYSAAFQYLDTLNKLSVDLHKEQTNLVTADLVAGFEKSSKKKEIEILHKNRDRMIYYNSRLVSMRNGLVLSLCFCLVLGGVIYKAYRDKRNVNKVLMNKFSEIRLKNAEILNKSKEIAEINSSLMDSNITLNRKEFQLKEAQRIAGLGSWEFDFVKGKFMATEYMNFLFFENEITAEERNFRDFLKCIEPADWPLVKTELKRLFASGNTMEVEFRILAGGELKRYLRARAVQMSNENGKPILLVGTVLDNSEQKKAEFTLREAKEHAEFANHSKSVFLANMSHEIRTPLNGILGFTNILLKECNIPQQREYLQHIRNSGDNLLVLLNDILDFNKIEQGKLQIEETNFQIREMIDAAIAPYIIQANEKGLDIKVHFSPEIPANIIGDPYRTRQVLINYLSNAIKFTKSGKIVIDISVAEMSIPDGKEMKLIFTVSDSGIGVPEDKKSEIFDAFTQADSSTTRNYGGTGLGLAINYQLTRLMNGNSGVVSPGRLATPSAPGSDFWFTVRVKRGEYFVKKANANTTENTNVFPTRLNVLVAEDNTINQLLIRKILESMNCDVTLVENGKLAVEALSSHTFDALLLDIQMPVMDGLQAAMIIRQSGNSTLPIIGVSANVFKEDVEKSLAAGMDAHLGKPFTAKDLYNVLKEKIQIGNTSS